MGVHSESGLDQGISVLLLSQGLQDLIGNHSFNSSFAFLDVCPPELYDFLLKQITFAMSLSCTLIPTP